MSRLGSQVSKLQSRFELDPNLAHLPATANPNLTLGLGFTESLKLGTYTVTCLGVGGICSDSAIAVLPDVNKKVLYARDRRGRVIARQLLAIADDDRLVCFRVYPQSSPASVKAAFREYDCAFSRALGIPLYEAARDDDPGYRVSSVLSVYWWDDGSWDFNTDQ